MRPRRTELAHCESTGRIRLPPTAAVVRRALAASLSSAAPDPSPRRAAVAIVVHTGSRLNILLIQRAEHPNDPWSGHMGLPGGRWEPEDQTLLQTARRETKEEVGLDLARDGELVGLLPTIPAVARGQATDLTISPFVFLYDGISTLTTNDEVQAALWVPLETLDRKALTVAVHRDGHIVSLPGWNVEGRTVWGLTHGILRHLLAELDRR